MTVEEFARWEQSHGARVIAANGIFWRRVRPFFYRPLLPYQEFPPPPAAGPFAAFPGGFQHAVPPSARTNSVVNLLLCENPATYSLNDLDRHERREIKRAAEAFTVAPATDVNEFREPAYRVYRSFYDRTKYGYQSGRRHEGNFAKWADLVFRTPKVIVLAAHKRNRELGAVGIWQLVEDTMVYSTFFCDTESLRLHVTGLMLHTMREALAGCRDVRQIFVGSWKYDGARGVDAFYLARGCKLVSKPAWLQLNPLTAWGLKWLLPRQYGQLLGNLPQATGDQSGERGVASRRRGIAAIPGAEPSVEEKSGA